MIELNGLTYANRATCPAESVAPELWPEWAIAPVLGCSGRKVPNIAAAGNDAALLSAASWSPSGVSFSGITDSYIQIPTMPVGMGAGDSFTLLFAANSTGSDGRIQSYLNGYGMSYASTSGNFYTWSGNVVASVPTGLIAPFPDTVCACVRDQQLGNIRAYINGTLASSMAESQRNIASQSACNIGASFAGENLWTGDFSYVAFYSKPFNDDKAQLMAADPLFPFRRRKQRSWFPALASFRPWFMRPMEVIQ